MESADPRARWEAVEEWRTAADVDRTTAATCLAVPSLWPSVAFHSQQALEKLLKGFLTLAGKRGGKTHSLERLGAAAAASFPEIAGLVAAAKDWSKPLPEEAEFRRALAVIDELAERLRAANREPPAA